MRLKLLAAGTPTATSPDGADPARPGRPRRTPSLPQPKCLCKEPKFARLTPRQAQNFKTKPNSLVPLQTDRKPAPAHRILDRGNKTAQAAPALAVSSQPANSRRLAYNK